MLDTTANVSKSSIDSTSYKKKLIEVALPLQAINAASAREKSIRHGHPSTLHLWWARRPLAACRAVLFASLVDDPSSDPERFPTVDDQEKERKRLFGLIEELVQWENSLNENVLSRARAEIVRCVGEALPTMYDPFCGGGAIPSESQRLGLPTLASDLNPVAVLITKALTEIPWRFNGRTPVHPSLRGPLSERTWHRATGLAADLAAYGHGMIDEARKRVGTLYPTIRANGREATVVAWLWARTIKCSNPVCGAQMPLVKSFGLSTRRGREWSIEPIVDLAKKTVTFETRAGGPSRGGTVDRRGAVCIVCGESMPLSQVRDEGKAKRIGHRLLAIVADGPTGRIYLPPDAEHERVALSASPPWKPDTDLPLQALGFRVQAYGMTKHSDLFSSRQLLILSCLSDLVRETRELALAHARIAMPDDGRSLEAGGSEATAYADAVATYLAFVVDRGADYSSNLCFWDITREATQHVFGRQTISMKWDYAESNPFSDSSGNIGGAVEWVQKVVASTSAAGPATVFSADASESTFPRAAFCTDPPYYDNVPYADLSDFFYVWLRSSLRTVYPELLATLLVPKSRELVADPARFGGSRESARRFFEGGLGKAFQAMRDAVETEIPTTVFYAFKQTDQDNDRDESSEAGGARASVGWEAMLSGLLGAGFHITGTWPMTTEQPVRLRSIGSNALASSIILVCRPRPADAPRCSRADFIRDLRTELPVAVQRLRNASLAATDLQQAALGPGMAIFSRFTEVLEPNDSPMTVRSALTLINEELAQILLGEISEVDAETHFALAWFDEYGYEGGQYGKADVLIRAKNGRLESLVHAGVLLAEAGRVQLLQPKDVEMIDAMTAVSSYPAWAQTMYLLKSLVSDDGSEEKAAGLLRAIEPGEAERIKDIAYHCYLACDRAKRATEARDFNALVAAWPELQRLAAEHQENRLL